MSHIISGIQQIGVGVSNLRVAWKWYKEFLGFDVRIFEDDTVAELMLPYTGGKPQQRHAALALNLQGGGGMEIWQYKGRTPLLPTFEVQLGDLGIFAIKIKSTNVDKAYQHFVDRGYQPITKPQPDPSGVRHFFIKDPFNNTFEIFENPTIFKDEGKPNGGVAGAIVGSAHIDRSIEFYAKLLGYDMILSDETSEFRDLAGVAGGTGRYRRVLLTHSLPRKGAFSKFFAQSYIELFQVLNREPKKIFGGRQWGDLGFIHICFDIKDMVSLEKVCNSMGHPFTVNSNVKHNEQGSFDMGEAAGHFTYIEDPDGTLIEFVEAHRIPIFKPLGLNLNLDKRDPEKQLPDFVIKLMGLKRVKGL